MEALSPIIVDPSFVPPPPPTSVTSSDGVLTATLDPAWFGVTLKANYSGGAALGYGLAGYGSGPYGDPLSSGGPSPVKVAFYRDGVPVRSGDMAWAPGGVAIAYDHEAPLGVASSWTAVPHFSDGTTGAESSAAVLTVPNPVAGKTGVWLKSVEQPSLSRAVWLETAPKVGLSGNVSLNGALGSRYPVGSWDVRSAYTTSFALVTETAQQRADLEALLDSGPLMFQTGTSVDVADFYFLPGDVSWEFVSAASDATRRWTVAATQIARPATVDSSLLMPGLSWASTAATYASWSTLTGAKASWAALLGA